jgi:hypothetical protein
MSTSDAAVQVAPSYGERQVPDVAAQSLFVTTLVPSLFRTVSLKGAYQSCGIEKGREKLDTKGEMDGLVPSVAGAADRVPVREQITVVCAIINRSLDRESRQLGLCSRGRRDAGLWAPVLGSRTTACSDQGNSQE